MKLRVLVPRKKYSSIIALVVAVLSINIPKTDARSCCHHRRPSSGLSLHGNRGNVDWIRSSWEYSPFGYSGNMLDGIMTEFFGAPLLRLNPLIEQSQRHHTRTMSHSSPPYEITESDTKMNLSLDLAGVHPDDVSIVLRDGGKAISISGLRKYKRHGETVTSKFDRTFTIDDAVVDVGTIEATLSEGTLVLSALKKSENKSSTKRAIPIHKTEAQENTSRINHTEEVEASIEEGTANNLDNEKVDTDDDIEISQEEDITNASDDIEISQEEDIM